MHAVLVVRMQARHTDELLGYLRDVNSPDREMRCGLKFPEEQGLGEFASSSDLVLQQARSRSYLQP